MSRNRTSTLLALGVVVGFVGQAWAEDNVPKDIQELRRAHQADEDDRYQIPEKPRPHAGREQKLHPARQAWRCLGIDAWQRVYAKPDLSSVVIGLTQPQIAVTGDPVNGFFSVLYYNGTLGYVPAAQVRAFRQPNNPATTCTFAGLTADGQPMFRFDLSQPGR